MRSSRFLTLTSLLVLSSAATLAGCVAGSGDSGTPSGGSTSTGSSTALGGGAAAGGKASSGGSSAGGQAAAGGASASGGSNSGGGAAVGGSAVSGGAGPSGGSDGSTGGGSPSGGAGPDVDEGGKMNASPGDSTMAIQDYLRIGEIRILNNNWGSAALGCNDTGMSVFVNTDNSFGWTFDRKVCGGKNNPTKPDTSHPDFPQIEFGVHPFGAGSELATSPDYSSTMLMPIQLKAINSASVTVDNLSIDLQNQSSWNVAFEFWLSTGDPLKPNPGVYAELMTFWGWQANRWPDSGTTPGPIVDDQADNGREISSGGKTYKLWVQDDQWAKEEPNWPNGKWRYFQFRDKAGPSRTFNGKVDLMPFIEYLTTTKGYSKDLWISRMEIGSEIDDNTSGKVTMKGVTFEVNGTTRSQVIVAK